MSRIFTYVLSALWLLVTAGCATSRPQTCPPHDQRCQLLLLLSHIDIGPSNKRPN